MQYPINPVKCNLILTGSKPQLRPKLPEQTRTWRQQWTADDSYIFQLRAAMLMMCSGWWCTEALNMPLPRCENAFSLSRILTDYIKPRLQCVTLWSVILKSMHTLHSPLFFLIFTDLFAHTSQVAGLTLITLSKITVRWSTQLECQPAPQRKRLLEGMLA